jgi:hypothetical protein
VNVARDDQQIPLQNVKFDLAGVLASWSSGMTITQPIGKIC